MERLLNIEDAAAALGTTPETLRRLARRGSVPCVKLGAEWRFPSDIAAIVLYGTVPERSGNVTDVSPGVCGNVAAV